MFVYAKVTVNTTLEEIWHLPYTVTLPSELSVSTPTTHQEATQHIVIDWRRDGYLTRTTTNPIYARRCCRECAAAIGGATTRRVNLDALFFGLRRGARGSFELVRLPRSYFQRHGRLTQIVVKTSAPSDPAAEEEATIESESRVGRLKRFLERSANGFVGGARIPEHPTAVLKAF